MAHLAARGEGQEARVAVVVAIDGGDAELHPQEVAVRPVRPGTGEDWGHGTEGSGCRLVRQGGLEMAWSGRGSPLTSSRRM
jgi:hypothetical protein